VDATAPSYGGLTGSQWAGVGGSAGAAVGGWLASNATQGSAEHDLGTLRTNADVAGRLSNDLLTRANDLTNPASAYFRAIISGDRQQLLAATMPERRRVIDQYSSARKAIASFQPRSGGTAAANNDMASREASDLAFVSTGARTAAANAALSAGSQMTSQGLQAQQLASTDLTSLITALQRGDQQSSESGTNWGQIAGTIAAYAAIAAIA
jgi:hypothetical protein